MNEELRSRLANWVLRHRWLAALVYSVMFLSPLIVFWIASIQLVRESAYEVPLAIGTILSGLLVFLFWAFVAPRLIRRSLVSGDWSWERRGLIFLFGVAIAAGIAMGVLTA